MNILKIVVIVITICLSACGSGNKDNSAAINDDVDIYDLDLTGTWIYLSKSDVFSSDTDQFLYSYYKKHVYFFEDTSQGVHYSRCEDFGEAEYLGVKIDEGFQFEHNDLVFTVLNSNKLEHQYGVLSGDTPNTYSKGVVTLVRIGNQTNTDWGNVEIVGNGIDVNEYDTVCAEYSYRSDSDDIKYLDIYIPYYDDSLALEITYFGSIEPGVYVYEKDISNDQFIYLGIGSNAIQFINDFPSGHYEVNSATIELFKSELDILSGDFEFVGARGKMLGGSFYIDLRQP